MACDICNAIQICSRIVWAKLVALKPLDMKLFGQTIIRYLYRKR